MAASHLVRMMSTAERRGTLGLMADLVEIKQKERLSREQAAARLRTLADQLARHNEVAFDRGGITVKARVPDEVDLEVELEIADDGSGELEIELSW